MTAAEADIVHALRGLAAAIADPTRTRRGYSACTWKAPSSARQRLGAQPPLTVEATFESVQRLHALAPIRVARPWPRKSAATPN